MILSLALVINTIYSTMLWVQSTLPVPNVIPLSTTTFVVPNVIIMIIGLILVTAPNAFPDCLFINPLCTHVVFERSSVRE